MSGPAHPPEPQQASRPRQQPQPPLVRMLAIERLTLTETEREVNLRLESPTLLVVSDGHGTATVAARLALASPGKCFLLSPRQTIVLRNDNPDPLSGYRIEFEALRDDEEWFGQDREFVFEPYAPLEDRLHDLLRESDPADRLAPFHRHIQFQSLLFEVLRRLPSAEDADEALGDHPPSEARKAVERTIAHLHRAYREEIEIGSLAQEAKLSRWQYGNLFRDLTGESPNRYLNRLRMEQAKRLLAASPSSRVNEIAERVGFRDEYYFSRRFKQTTGLTPTQFARSQVTTPRIFSVQYLGELLALGIRPIGSNRAMIGALPEEAGDIPAVDDVLDEKSLSALTPDLIVYPSFLPPKLAKRLSQIAPAYEIDWNVDVYTRLRLMGEMLGKDREAADWIHRYQEKARRTRRNLQGSILPGETASAFIFHADHLYVYGGHHFGHTLYEGVGFEQPPGIRALLERNKNAKWQRIPFEALPDYTGDRVFMALADRGIDALQGKRVLEHPAWKSLPAVRAGKSYVVRDSWANYNPLTLDRHLDEMVHCLKP